MAAEDLVPDAPLGEALYPGAVIVTMKCDEDNVRKGRFVTLTAGENWPPVCHEADAGEKLGGVALEAGNNGDYISVLIHGIVKIYAGAAVGALELLKSDAEGRAIPIAATNVYMEGAVALMSAGEADDQFVVFVSLACTNAVLA